MPTLNFRGRAFVERYHENLPYHTLVMQPELSVLGSPTEVSATGEAPSVDGNLIIEGDNLLGLVSLLPHYRGQIKCIYIDPPYNTGNEHWVYNDNVSGALFKEWIGKEVGSQGEDFNRHEKWCCMMYPRLQLLKELLRDDGVIFISIDDNEVHHLRMLMDDIFGEDNFIASFVWQKKYGPANDASGVSATHEYVICYAKSKENWTPNLFTRTESQLVAFSNPDDDPRGSWRMSDLSARTFSNSGDYVILGPTGKEFRPPATRAWIVNEKRYEELLKDNRIVFGADGNGRPMQKRFLSEVRQGITPETWWSRDKAGDNKTARYEIKDVLPENLFETPKPTQLLNLVLTLSTTPDDEDIILDSFAGSGTTAQAVLELNKADGGNRRFILVQLPYDNKEDETSGRNIARDITRERVKRVIEGRGEKVPALGGSFTYCTLSEDPLKGYYGILRPGTSWQELAGYIWQSETNGVLDAQQMDEANERIGQNDDMAIYLFYTPDDVESKSFTEKTLAFLVQEPAHSILVYCEKLWVEDETLREWAKKHKKDVWVRLLPTQLR